MVHDCRAMYGELFTTNRGGIGALCTEIQEPKHCGLKRILRSL